MDNKLPRLQDVSLALGAAMLTLCLPYRAYAQTPAPQDQQAVQTQAVPSQNQMQDQDRQANPDQDRQARSGDDITRRDLAQFDRFLDSHRETAEQLRRTPALIDDPQFLQSHPQLNTYLQDHPGVKQEISQRPDSFMRAEDLYRHDRSLRDRDADGQYRDTDRQANGQDRNANGMDRNVNGQANGQDRNANGQATNQATGQDRDADRRDVDANRNDTDRSNDRRDVASFDRFLDQHREIAQQVRRDPSLLDSRSFVQNHPSLQAYLQDNPGVRDQFRQNPNAFMHQEEAYNRNPNMGDRDPMHDHMANFGGFLNNHSTIQHDLWRDPSVVKDHQYVQNHAELDAYLTAHPDVRGELMADPQGFVQGSRQYSSSSSTGGSGSGAGRGTGSTGSGTSMTGSSTSTSTTTGTSTKPTTMPQTPHQPQMH